MKFKEVIKNLIKKKNINSEEKEMIEKKEKFSDIKIEEKITGGDRKNGFVERYQNGKLISITPYCDGKIDGRVYTYYEDGSIESVTNYKNGKLHGISVIYDRYGNVTYDSEYKEGSLTGNNNLENKDNWYDREF